MIIALVVVMLGSMLGCGSERRAGKPEPAAGAPTSSAVLPCTEEDEPTNFVVYSLGTEFEGLPLNSQERHCSYAPPGAPPQVRQNVVLYTYGTCEPPPGEGGCPPPVSVQTKPRCETGFSPASHHNPLAGKERIRGVDARVYDGGYRLEVQSGGSMVTIFADSRAQLLRAGRALVKAPAKPSDAVKEGDVSAPLPSPPPGLPASGPTPCR